MSVVSHFNPTAKQDANGKSFCDFRQNSSLNRDVSAHFQKNKKAHAIKANASKCDLYPPILYARFR